MEKTTQKAEELGWEGGAGAENKCCRNQTTVLLN